MGSHKFLNPQVGSHIINNIKFTSYLTENKGHINYKDYLLNIFLAYYVVKHTKHISCAKCKVLTVKKWGTLI
jgi:hypothetical protein